MQKVVALCAIVVTAVLSWTAAQKVSAVPAPRDNPQAIKWEYGILYLGDECGWTAAGEALRSEDRQDSAKAIKDLAEKMKAAIPDAKPDAFTLEVAILDHLGKQGWELISSPSGKLYIYRFKRLAPERN